MKKIYLLIVFICSLVFLPNFVLADDNVLLSLDCKSTPDQTNNISCDLTANTNGKSVNSLSFKYSIDSSLKFSSFNSNVGNFKENNSNINLTNVDFSGNNVKVGTLYFKSVSGSNGNKRITLSDIKGNSGENSFTHKSIYDSVYITLSTNREITSLNINSGILSPTFNSSIYNYTIDNYKEDTIDISATHNGSSISGVGTHKLVLGENIIKLVVTAQNGNTRTYKITVNKIDGRSSDTTLSNITLNSGEIGFRPDIREYEINTTASSIDISVEKNTSKQSVEINPGKTVDIGIDELKNITITVTSESGKKEDYILHIKRIESTDPSLNFKKFMLNGSEFELNKYNNIYNISVANSVTMLNFEYELEDENTEVEVSGNEDFAVGTNEVIIKLKNKNKEEKIYTFWVNRKENIDVLENKLDDIILELEGNKDKIYVSLKELDENKIIYKDVLNKLCDNDKTLIYEIIDENDGILYEIILEDIMCSEYKDDIDISYSITSVNGDIKKLVKENEFMFIKENDIDLPEGSKLKLFVGDKFKNNDTVYVYKYEDGKLKFIKKNIKIKDGFITLDSDDLSSIVITKYNKDSVKHAIDPDNKIDNKPNKIFVTISLLIEFSVILGLIIYIVVNNRKFKKMYFDI